MDGEDDAIEVERVKLRLRIDDWRVKHQTYIGALYSTSTKAADDSPSSSDDDDEPEHDTLFIPSDFSRLSDTANTDPTLAHARALIQCEQDIRLGRAFELIETLKSFIMIKLQTYKDARWNVRGKQAQRKSKKVFDKIDRACLEIAHDYNTNRNRLLKLGFEADGPLKEIDPKKDFRMRDTSNGASWREATQRGKSDEGGAEVESWIWRITDAYQSSKEVPKVQQDAYVKDGE